MNAIRVEDMVDIANPHFNYSNATNGLSKDREWVMANGPHRVTRTSTNYVWLRIIGAGYYGDDTTIQVPREDVGDADPNRPRPRRLGEVPVEEGKEFIDPQDPRIQWLWEDFGTFATQQGYCPQYDALCARLGIPGRKRAFNAFAKIGDTRVTATIEAHSQREANEELARRISENQAEPVAA